MSGIIESQAASLPSVVLLQVNENASGTLNLTFPGRSSAPHERYFRQVIAAAVKQRKKIKSMLFDLSGVDPVNNTVGRIFDIAAFYAKKHGMKVEMRVPANVYQDFRSVAPNEFPETVKSGQSLDRVRVTLTEPVTQSKVFQREAKPIPSPSSSAREFFCRGKVSHVADDVVTVRLFTEKGEMIGKLARMQFGELKLCAGTPFEYTARVIGPGKTEVSVTPAPRRQLGPEEILDIWEETGRKIPENEF